MNMLGKSAVAHGDVIMLAVRLFKTDYTPNSIIEIFPDLTMDYVSKEHKSGINCHGWLFTVGCYQTMITVEGKEIPCCEFAENCI